MMDFFLMTFWFSFPFNWLFLARLWLLLSPLEKRFILSFLREQQTVERVRAEQAGVSLGLLVISTDAGGWHSRRDAPSSRLGRRQWDI